MIYPKGNIRYRIAVKVERAVSPVLLLTYNLILYCSPQSFYFSFRNDIRKHHGALVSRIAFVIGVLILFTTELCRLSPAANRWNFANRLKIRSQRPKKIIASELEVGRACSFSTLFKILGISYLMDYFPPRAGTSHKFSGLELHRALDSWLGSGSSKRKLDLGFTKPTK